MRRHKSELVREGSMDLRNNDDRIFFLVDFQNTKELWPNMELEEAKTTNWKFSQIQGSIIYQGVVAVERIRE